MAELNERKRVSDADVQRLESEVAMLKETAQIAQLDKQVAEEKVRPLLLARCPCFRLQL